MAIVVLSVGLLGLSAMTIATIKGLSFSKKLTTATTLSQDKIEEIEQNDYAGIDSAAYPAEEYETIAGHAQFKRVVTINVNSPLPNMKTIMVTTSWKGTVNQVPRDVMIKTIVKK